MQTRNHQRAATHSGFRLPFSTKNYPLMKR